ncbi:MAG: M10 family metallopeptidase C-terminal domain-containing protein [Sulfuritalea sp.]|nr:M10 family metallopeptidase C-terminal domain-containing protein [Sulfuritalea sp.]
MSLNQKLDESFAKKVDLGNTPKTVIAFPYSGDYRVDVLIDGPRDKWSPDLATGQVRTVTYSFALTQGYLAGVGYEEERDELTPFTQAEITAARKIFAYMGSILPINFVEVVESTLANSPVGEIRMANNKQSSAGYAFSPSASDTKLRGDIFLSNSYTKESFAAGTYEYDTLIHEIAHAIGLKHPGNYNAGSAPSTEPGNYLANSEDSKMLSVVSYAEHEDFLQRIDFAPYDLLALKYLYGLKAQNVGDNTYAWTDSIGGQLQTLVDDGGRDTIDLKNITQNTVLDLREGYSSDVGTWSFEDLSNLPSQKNLQIAYGTVIEVVRGSNKADAMIGNASNNLFEGRGGNDVLNGGEGLDTAVWSGLFNQYKLSRNQNGFTVEATTGSEGKDQIQSIERLSFSDQGLALDISANAGITAKVIGAVFGKAALTNKQYVGIGLYYLDELSFNYGNLLQLAINARLGANPSHEQVVDLLYTNVIGQAPDAATRKTYTTLLDNQTYSVASLGVLAADTEYNKANVNLVGLAQTGLGYLPFTA